MMKRNRFDIGRFIALLLAAILAAILPLRMMAGSSVAKTDKNITMLLDAFTSGVGQKGCITIRDYEQLLSCLNSMGNGFEMRIEVEREAESLAGRAVRVAAHTHGTECYAGHNHKANGCRFHVHTDSCRCGGRFITYSYTESGSSLCYKCMGTGKTGKIEVCPSCNGNPPDWTEVTCPFCDGVGKRYYDVWYVCPNCNGAGCDVCDEGKPGGWYKNEYTTCNACSGSGKVLDRIPCSRCGGKGTVGEIKTCDACMGGGAVERNVTHYTCDTCGIGDSVSYGTICDRLACGMDFESYECGITNEDTVPRCDRIIVDASYTNTVRIRQFDSQDMVDTTIRFKYLNGSERSFRSELVSGSDSFDSSRAGTLNLNLSYTGYYESAVNYETRFFPISVIVDAAVAVCGRCGQSYFLNTDGSDPGCPYCMNTDFSIKVVVNGDVIQGNVPDIDVFKVTDSKEEPVDKGDYTVFYDSDTLGTGEAAVYYNGNTEYFTIRVVPDPENDPGNGQNGSENEGGNGTGSGNGNSDPGNGEGNGNSGNAGENGSGEGSGTNTEDQGHNGQSGITPSPGDTGIRPETIENKDEVMNGKYVHIPDEDIVSLIYLNGVYELLPGDMLNVTVTVKKGNVFERILEALFIPESLKERYTSGMTV